MNTASHTNPPWVCAQWSVTDFNDFTFRNYPPTQPQIAHQGQRHGEVGRVFNTIGWALAHVLLSPVGRYYPPSTRYHANSNTPSWVYVQWSTSVTRILIINNKSVSNFGSSSAGPSSHRTGTPNLNAATAAYTNPWVYYFQWSVMGINDLTLRHILGTHLLPEQGGAFNSMGWALVHVICRGC